VPDLSVRAVVVCALLGAAACGSVAQKPDAGPPCPAGLAACGAVCVNPQSDNLHCGDCDTACEAGYACSAGQCELTCQTGLVACDTRCVDPLTDAMNCGATGDCVGANAGTTCSAQEFCDGAGTCATACQTGFVACDGTCIDPNTDETHCGASGNCGPNQMGVMCMPGQSCMAGACVQPLQVRRVFVTSTLYTGALGGLTGADQKCQQHAAAAGLTGIYRAWLANGMASPRTRFTQSQVPYVLVDGTLIANNWTDLVDGALAAPINRTELGQPPPIGNTICAPMAATVWSNVLSDGSIFDPAPGQYDYSCQGWTVAGDMNMANWGLATDTSGSWSAWCNGGMCSWLSPLYCFEQ